MEMLDPPLLGDAIYGNPAIEPLHPTRSSTMVLIREQENTHYSYFDDPSSSRGIFRDIILVWKAVMG